MAIMDKYAALRRLTPIQNEEPHNPSDPPEPTYSDGWAEFDLQLSLMLEKQGVELTDIEWENVLTFFRNPDKFFLVPRKKKKTAAEDDAPPPP